jgi:ferredoxin-like protein FixX
MRLTPGFIKTPLFNTPIFAWIGNDDDDDDDDNDDNDDDNDDNTAVTKARIRSKTKTRVTVCNAAFFKFNNRVHMTMIDRISNECGTSHAIVANESRVRLRAMHKII